jgi:uncharacterized protein
VKLTSVLPRRSLFTDTCSIYAVSNNSCYDINYRTDRFKSWIGTNSDVRHSVARYGITVILMRFHFDERKSGRLRANPKRGIGFEEAQEVFSHAYYLDQRSDLPEQYRAIGWVGERLYTVIFEVREDEEGEYYHLVTLWKATKQERQLYAEHS